MAAQALLDELGRLGLITRLAPQHAEKGIESLRRHDHVQTLKVRQTRDI